MIERLPPNNVEAEEAVLGSLLIDPDAIYEVTPKLKPPHFYRFQNRLIFEAMLTLHERKSPLDLITISEELGRREKLEEIGGEAYLIGLLNTVPTSVNARSYGDIVWQHHIRRLILRAASQQANLAYDEALDIDSVVAKAHGHLLEATGEAQVSKTVTFKQAITAALQSIEARIAAGGAIGLKTGYKELDAQLKGIEAPDLIYLGARPGVGKTAFLGNLALRIARHGLPVAYFNLEMKPDQLGMRWLSCESGVYHSTLKEGTASQDEHADIIKATGRIAEYPIFLFETWSLTPTELLAICRRIQAQYGLALVMVDYVQLMEPDKPTGKKYEDVSYISRKLKQAAGFLDVPILAAVQLNRAIEQRKNKEPSLSDLRDSGNLEQDGDDVWFMHRESKDSVITRLTVAKRRNGPTFEIDLRWHPSTQRFTGLDEQDEIVF